MASSSTLSMLPLDLIREILLRTPAKSLVRSMMTCKQWNNLINDKYKSFIYEHLARSKERFLRIDETVQIMDPVTSKNLESPMPDELQSLTITASVHCNGLMLCMCSDMRSRFGNLALWNPLTKKFSWVSREGFEISDRFGIGYDVTKPHRYDYKILKLSDRLNGEVEVQIYECMSKSWRTLLDNTKVDWEVYPSCNGVAVMGNMYWLAKKETGNYVLGFDFTNETFKDICFCRLPYDTNYLGCYDGDKLSLLEQSQEVLSPIEVWVSSKLADGNVSFVQYFKVAITYLPALRFSPYTAHPVYCIAKDKRIITWCEDDVNDEEDWVSSCIALYEIDEARVRTKHETERHHGDDYVETFFCGYVYVPSLVPLPV